MIQPSALRIGQKVMYAAYSGEKLEWTVFKLDSDFAHMRHTGFINIAVHYTDIDPSDIVPTDYDKAVEELLDAVDYELKEGNLILRATFENARETLQKASEAK